MNIINKKNDDRGKRILLISLLILLFSTVSVYSQTYDELVSNFVENQNKIQTFIGMGSLSIDISMGGNAIQQITSEITMYMKRPDWFKMLLNIDGQQTITVQKGELVTQKMPGNDTVMTQQADINSNLASRFFFNNFEEDFSNVEILEQSTYESEGKIFRKFKVKYAESDDPEVLSVDYIVLHFNDQGLYVKSEMVSDSVTIISTEISYQIKNDINVFKTIKISTDLNGMKMQNSIEYSGVSINSTIQDKIFSVK